MANRVSFVVIAKDAFTVVGRKIAATTGKMTRGFSTLSKKLKLTTGRFDGLILSLGTFFGARKLLTEGTKFEDSIADLAAITGAAGKDLKFLSDESLRLSKVAIVSSSETATAFKLVASAKAELLKNPKALSNVTEQTLLLANASGIDLSTSATVVTEALNQFGAAAEEANRFVNVLAAGSKFGASEVAQTGAAIVKSGVAAKFADLSFEELNSTIQILAQQGIKGEIAGTQLKTSLIKLEAQGIKKIRPSVVGYTKALENLNDMNLDASQMQKLFGLEAIATGSIIANSSASIRDMTDSISGTDIASQQSAIRLGTFSKRIKGIGITIDNKLIKAFEKMDSPLNKMADKIEAFINSIGDKEIKNFADSMSFTADTVLVVAKGIGLIVDGLKAIGKFAGTAAALTVSGLEKSPNLPLPLMLPAALLNADFKSFFGGGSQEVAQAVSQSVNVKNQGDFTLTVKDPGNNVDSVKSTAKTPLLKMGINMETGLGVTP